MRVAHILEDNRPQNQPVYLHEAFGDRAIREMELALLKACDSLPRELDNHDCRSHIAKCICARVQEGERTFGGMVTAAMAAIDELQKQKPR